MNRGTNIWLFDHKPLCGLLQLSISRNDLRHISDCALALNFIIQLTPCYMHDQYDLHRNLFYIVTLALVNAALILWYLFYASDFEKELFTSKFGTALTLLIVGYVVFFFLHVPERWTDNYYI